MRCANGPPRDVVRLIIVAGIFMSAVPQIAGQTQSTAPAPREALSVSGKVIMENGAPPPAPVSIEVFCGGVAGMSGSTDAKGGFSLSRDSTPDAGNTCGILPQEMWSGSIANVETLARQCLVRIRLVGYRSETKNLLFNRNLPPGSKVNLDVGATTLHPLAGVKAAATSVVSQAAPKQAKEAFEKGMASIEARKPDEAVEQLEKAVQIDPRYAEAWFELGRARERQGDFEGAVLAYSDSISRDPAFFQPYVPLTLLLVEAKGWAALASISSRAVQLDPIDFPWLWVANATANFWLGKSPQAEEAARQAIKIDTWHEYPVAHYILGVLLSNRGDLEAAAEQMRTYVELAPNEDIASTARQQLTRIEEALAARKAPAGPASK